MFRKFIKSPSNQPIVIGFLVVAVLAAVYSIYSNASAGDAERAAGGKMYVDSKTGDAFYHKIVAGEKNPIAAPSGGNTGYPAEACYWTKDGQIKSEPTWVLLREFLHEPGPTFCPDCGRVVVVHNPQPHPGDKPPPTKEQWGNRPAPAE